MAEQPPEPKRRVVIPEEHLPPGVVKEDQTPSTMVPGYALDTSTVLPEMSNHFHWTIQCAMQVSRDTGQLLDVTVVTVEAPDEETALTRAAQIVKRNLYRVASVSEACTFELKKEK
jgi:hypothetical protein